MSYKLNNIVFQKGQGGSGRQANGNDYISALLFYNDTRPAALLASLPGGVDNFASGSVIQIFSSDNAKSIGIDDSYSDEVKNTSVFTLISSGATGDKATIVANEWIGGSGKGTVALGSYTNSSSDDLDTFCAGLAAAINANTNSTGYSAISTGSGSGIITITSRPGLGIYPNNAVNAHFYTGTCTGAVDLGAGAATIEYGTDGTAGVASKLAVYYYHIQRYFTVKPDGTLYIGIFNTAGSATFSDLVNIMNYSKSSVVQCGIWDDTATFALSKLTAIQTQVNALEATYQYLSSVVYAADIKAFNGGAGQLAALAGGSGNLATLTASNVSALIDNDGNGNGFDLFQQQQKSITSLGACIGCISQAAISEDIGNLSDTFNVDDGVEFDTLIFGEGTQYITLPKLELDSLNNNKYLFLSKFPQTSGSWYSDDWTACPLTSDYSEIRDNRTIDRVIRNLFSILAPVIKSRLKLNVDGTLTVQTISYLTSLCGEVIKPLIASGDLAGDADNFDASKWIIINPSQKPNVTGNLVIAVKLVENGIAHSIIVPIGFVQSL